MLSEHAPTMPSARTSESGAAMIAAIAMLLLGALVVVAVITSARTSSDGARSRLNSQAADQLARDAGTMLAAMYSAGVSGEHDGFLPGEADLRRHATLGGGTVVRNSTLGSGLNVVDTDRVPANRQFTVRQPLRDGRTGYWQVLSARLPQWGVTAGGRVVVYVRTWTSGTGGAITKPSIHRIEFRPTWFADYQLLFDGPTLIGSTTVLNGRVHSNGHKVSYYNQYDPQYETDRLAIKLSAGARCTGTARVSVSALGIGGPGIGGCPAQYRASGPAPQVNIQRAQGIAKHLRAICARPAAERTGIDIRCSNSTSTLNVRLSGSSVIVDGVGTLNASVSGDVPGSRQGAVLVASGNVNVRGTLGARARALIVAAAPPNSATYGSGAPPSVWVTSGREVGARANDRTSSFGVVADGDVIFDEATTCPMTARGAFVAISGLMSIEPRWRVPIHTPGRTPCGGSITVEGSIVSHLPPLLNSPVNNAGYAGGRHYTYLASLYDNPPPSYPTAEDWSVVDLSPANLSCFRNGRLLSTGECA